MDLPPQLPMPASTEQHLGRSRVRTQRRTPLAAGGPATPMAHQVAEQPSLVRAVRRAPVFVRLVLVGMVVALAAVNGAIAFIVIDGRLDGQWYDIRDLGLAVGELRGWLDDRGVGGWLSYWVTAAIGGAGILSFVGGFLLIGTWIERRLLARFQIRRGPNRVGPFGLLQPIADAVKLVAKETVIPRGADRLLYFIPPVFVFVPALLGWGPVPWAPNMAYLDLNVGLVYVIAISSLAVLAVFMAGWSSNNHYALLGSMRTVAMMISYEIPISISLLAVALFAGSLQLSEIVAWQADHHVWMAFLLPFGLFTFFFSSTAEINRTPNDIGEAESEIVAGFHIEYSGMKAGLFLAVELGNALLLGALAGTLYLGGYTLFGLEQWIPPYLILSTKIAAGYFVLVWLRATLPRFRLDQLMAYAWKYLIPLSIGFVALAAVESAIFVRVDAPEIVTLGVIALVNLGVTVFAVRAWARVLGYRPPRAGETAPVLTTRVGGLRAAERLRTVG